MTQVDTSIYGNMLRPVKSVQEYDAEAQQAEGNRLGLLLQRGQYDAQQRGVAEDNAFRNALSSGADDRALMAASPTRALAFQEGRAKIAKEQALTTKAASEAKKTDWESAVAKQAHIAQLASSATDQTSWTQARKIAEMLGADVSQVPEQFDPATAKQFGSMAMTQAQRLDQAHKEATLAETTRNNKAQQATAARNASTAEGQLGVSRERLNFDKTNADKEASTGVTYQQDAQGNLVALPKSVTPGQSVTPMPVVTGGTAMQGKGSPKAAFTQQYGMVNGALKEVTDLLPKATASGAGAAADATLGFFGKSTEGGDAAAKLDTIGGWLTSTVPRFEGPQSDKDAMNYQRMAGDVANRKLPVSQRLEAAKSLKTLMDAKAKSYGLPVDGGSAPSKTANGATVSNW